MEGYAGGTIGLKSSDKIYSMLAKKLGLPQALPKFCPKSSDSGQAYEEVPIFGSPDGTTTGLSVL